MTRSASTPSSRAVRKSVDAARMCRPIVVLPEQEREQPERDDRDRDGEDRHLADVDAADRHHLVERRDRDGRLADRAVADVEDQRDAWSRNATANVVTSITAGDCVRSGRKTAPLHRERERDHDREAGERRSPATGQPDVNASV